MTVPCTLETGLSECSVWALVEAVPGLSRRLVMTSFALIDRSISSALNQHFDALSSFLANDFSPSEAIAFDVSQRLLPWVLSEAPSLFVHFITVESLKEALGS